jgi:hypothetical protein
MKIIKKWDFWFWFISFIYLISRIGSEIALPDSMGLQSAGIYSIVVVTIAIAMFLYGVIKVIEISLLKIKNQQGKALPIVAIVFTLAIAVYVSFWAYKVYYGV